MRYGPLTLSDLLKKKWPMSHFGRLCIFFFLLHSFASIEAFPSFLHHGRELTELLWFHSGQNLAQFNTFLCHFMVTWTRALSKINHPANPGHHFDELNMDTLPSDSR
jgi:hypothetical protein